MIMHIAEAGHASGQVNHINYSRLYLTLLDSQTSRFSPGKL